MGDDFQSLERRFDQLSDEVRALSGRVDELTLRLAGATAMADRESPLEVQAGDHDETPALTGDWTGATVLAGTAAVCFLLVIALTLRTLVDNRIIDQPIGAIAGLVYASLILVYGYYRAHAKQRYASLSTTCGITLVLAIVLETHFRFALLPAASAYVILAAALLVMLVMGLRYRAYGPFSIAIPGISAVAMSMSFPDPDFVFLGAVLALGMLAAYAVTTDPRTRWLVWCTLGVVGFFWMWWAIKLTVPLSRHEALLPTVKAGWFLPSLAVFTLLYMFQAVYAASSPMRVFGVFECAAPVITAVGAFFAARSVVIAAGGNPSHVGWAGIVAALVYAALSVWFAQHDGNGRRAAAWFAIAAQALLAIGIPQSTSSTTVALLVWTITAVVTSLYGTGRMEPVVQIAAIMLSVYACVYGAWQAFFAVDMAFPVGEVAAMAGLCAICVYHYSWLHRGADSRGGLHVPLPPAVRAVGMAVFFAGVIYAFGASRIVLYAALVRLFDDVGHYFECGQSMLINTGALVLAILALRWMRRDFLGIAVFVAFLGGVKVFTYDLLRTQGIPLVLSVFVFAITTTAGSLIWNRWQRAVAPDDANGPNSPITV